MSQNRKGPSWLSLQDHHKSARAWGGGSSPFTHSRMQADTGCPSLWHRSPCRRSRDLGGLTPAMKWPSSEVRSATAVHNSLARVGHMTPSNHNWSRKQSLPVPRMVEGWDYWKSINNTSTIHSCLWNANANMLSVVVLITCFSCAYPLRVNNQRNSK